MRFVIFLSLFVFLGCTQPQTEPLPSLDEKNETKTQEGSIILLMDNHKEHNAIVVSTATDSVVVDTANTFVTLDANDSKPSDAAVMDQEKIDALFADTLKALPKTPAKFVIYFERNSDSLSPESLEILKSVIEQVKLREPCEMAAVGFTDRKGSLAYNKALSKKRVNNTVSWIKTHKLNIINIKKIYKGEEDLSVATEDEILEPLNRRVELYIR
jgi:outer membrane protein OmpA-like peptidoglycan-associated protein